MIRLQRFLSIAAVFFAGTIGTVVHAQSSAPLRTGTFHSQVRSTSGGAAIYEGADGKRILRLTNFKTSSGPDVHVFLIAAEDWNANSLKKNIERVELGKLKGNQGDQDYNIPSGTDLSKFRTVAIHCKLFNATFGAAPLETF